MKTFEIKQGDLAIGPGGFATVSGASKVKQDLAQAVREPLSCDRFHPRWGTVLANFVGSMGDDLTQGMIVSEITRIVRNYIASQGEQVRSDLVAGRKPRYGTDELVVDLGDIDLRTETDRLYVRVKVQTAANQTVTLTSVVTL